MAKSVVPDQSAFAETGLEVNDLVAGASFFERKLHERDSVAHMQGLLDLARDFTDRPDGILQSLVEAAVRLCGADSAGISVEKPDGTPAKYWHWVATAGEYGFFTDKELPEEPSVCGVCLHRGRPQQLRVHARFFEIMEIEAAVVTDGLMLPWGSGQEQGTIWILAHGRTEAFDRADLELMILLADFAARAVRYRREAALQMEQQSAQAAAQMAQMLVDHINNPLLNLAVLADQASSGAYGEPGKLLAGDLTNQVRHLSYLVEILETVAAPHQSLG